MARERYILQGGLGNQLFTLAAAVYYKRFSKNQLPITLVTSELNRASTPRNLDLGSLNFDVEIKFEKLSFMIYAMSKVHNKFMRYLPVKSKNLLGLYNAQDPGFDAGIHSNLGNLRLIRGYFQSAEYVYDRKVFPTFVNMSITHPSKYYSDLCLEIERDKPLIVHVRRGDYLNHKNTFGLLSLEYFDKAIKSFPIEMRRRIWIFSDDENMENFSILKNKYDCFFPPTAMLTPVEIMFLMSKGKNLIISNSTFSWWAGFLMKGNNKNSIVLAPSEWCKSPDQFPDIIPSNWSKMESLWAQ